MVGVGDRETATTNVVAVPGYVVGESIGIGGFGEVFGARHAVIGRDVAIKVLHAKYSGDATAIARFVAEARAVNQIAHPNIVQVFDFGTLADGRQYCVMERIRGTTLRDLLRARGRLPLAEALPVLRGIAEGVDAAHAAGVAHRDLKPDNVFVLEGGGVKLIDFGLAKLTHDDPAAVPVTRTGAIFGTPLYMSPEQCRGKALDARTDCYSFGVLAYHVLVGAPPWEGDALELALHHLNDDPVPPSRRCAELDHRVDRVVAALLDKVPSRRPTPLVAAVDAMHRDANRTRPTKRVLWIAGALALAALAVFAVGSAAKKRPRAGAERSIRTVEWPEREFAVAIALTPSGDALVYVMPDRAVWKRRLGELTATPIALPDSASIRAVSVARDGRLLVSREEADGKWIWLEVPSGHRERVAQGEHGRIGPDDRIAFVRGGEVYTRDLATNQELLVASVGGKIRNVTWSPDGRRLAWVRGVPDNNSRAELLDMRDGAIRQLPNPLIRVSVQPMPLAFAGPSTLVYCDDQRRLQQLDVETGRERTLQQLGPDLQACAIEASGDGSRVFLIAAMIELSVGVLSTREPERGWRRLATGGVEDFTAHGEVVIADWTAPGPARHRTLYQPATFQIPSPATIPLDGGAATPLASCSGATRAIRRGSELLYNVNLPRDNALAMQLVRSSDCAVVDSWTIPDLPNWIFPRCGGELCATVRKASGGLAVWTLHHGEAQARALAQIPITVAVSEWLDLAVSPDGRHVAVVVPNARDDVFIVDASDGSIRTLHSGALPGLTETTNSAGTVTWASDSRAVYVTGGSPGMSAITRVSLDGAIAPLWSENRPSLGLWGRTSPDGAWIAANNLDIKLAAFVIDASARH